MNVEGLTIYHVKSHLQKYRTARYKPEALEGSSEKKSSRSEEMKLLDLKTHMGITEALRLQMEVQKQVHEQLEIQKNLQLRIEEQGRNLQIMFGKQRKIEEDKSKATCSDPGDPSAGSPNETQRCAIVGSITQKKVGHLQNEQGQMMKLQHQSNLDEEKTCYKAPEL